MTDDSGKTRAQKLLSKITDSPIVAYILVIAAIFSAIAGFTDTVGKIHTGFQAAITYLDLDEKDTNRPQSIWIPLGAYPVKNTAGSIIDVNEMPKPGYYVHINHPLHIVIADPLPLNIQSTDGGVPKPRKLPYHQDDTRPYYTNIPYDDYKLLDIDIVKLTTSKKATQKIPGEQDRIINIGPEEYERIKETHTEIWGRLENLKIFGDQ